MSSLVTLIGDYLSSDCGYCHGERPARVHWPDTTQAYRAASLGVSAVRLDPLDYEELMLQGWRRSGTWLYRPNSALTCCPQLPIRLNLQAFQPSKQQRKLLRKLAAGGTLRSNNAAAAVAAPARAGAGAGPAAADASAPRAVSAAATRVLRALVQQMLQRGAYHGPVPEAELERVASQAKPKVVLDPAHDRDAASASLPAGSCVSSLPLKLSRGCSEPRQTAAYIAEQLAAAWPRLVAAGSCAEAAQFGCAKVVPMATAGQAKLALVPAAGVAQQVQAASTAGAESATAPAREPAPERLPWRVVMEPAVFDPESFALYKRYQMAVHGDEESSLTQEQYTGFLVDSPLVPEPTSTGLTVPAAPADDGPHTLEGCGFPLDALAPVLSAMAAQAGVPSLSVEDMGRIVASCGGMPAAAADVLHKAVQAVHAGTFDTVSDAIAGMFGAPPGKYGAQLASCSEQGVLNPAAGAWAVDASVLAASDPHEAWGPGPIEASFAKTQRARLRAAWAAATAPQDDGSVPAHEWKQAELVEGVAAEAALGVPHYGTWHHKYYLGSQLVAVGVVDVLPRSVSSVYVFYDPDLPHLSLGRFTALREIQWAQALAAKLPSLRWYVMGFYVHGCPKMQYKADYSPSEVRCPTSGSWVSVDEAAEQLEGQVMHGPQPCLPALAAGTEPLREAVFEGSDNVWCPGLPICPSLSFACESFPLQIRRAPGVSTAPGAWPKPTAQHEIRELPTHLHNALRNVLRRWLASVGPSLGSRITAQV